MFDGVLRDVSEIKKVCAIGTGKMGPSTALTFAMSNETDIKTILCGREDRKIAAAMDSIGVALHQYAAHELIPESQIPVIMNRIRPVRLPDPEREQKLRERVLEDVLGDTNLVVESISEKPQEKIKLYSEFDPYCKPKAVICSNSSSIPPALLRLKQNPARQIIGLHFWNKPHFMPTVETVPNEHTPDIIMDVIDALMIKLGKVPVRLARGVPGFIGNRIQFALLAEALDMLDKGIGSREEIDAAVTNGFGRELATDGLLGAARNDGFDRLHADYQALESPLYSGTGVPAILERLRAEEELGITDEGKYSWSQDVSASYASKRVDEFFRHLKLDREAGNGSAGDLSPERRVRSNWSSSGTVERRLRHAALREALYIINAGIATEAQVDTVIKYSFGRRLSVTGPLISAYMGGFAVFSDIFTELKGELYTGSEIPYLEMHAGKNAGYGKIAQFELAVK